jgi:alkylation response protein AidB-like acyl-CoA dehydrogenase
MYPLHATNAAGERALNGGAHREASPLAPSGASREALASWVDQAAGPLLKRVSAAALEADRTGSPIARDVLVDAARCGLLCASLPRSVGGVGLSMQSWGRALERVGYLCDDSSFTLVITIFQAVANALLASGNAEIIERYVAPCCTGSRLVAFAYTENSDAFSLSTTMERRGDDFVVSGAKTMVTAGAIADAFMTYVVNQASGEMAVVIIDADAPGVTVQPIEAMGLRASGFAALRFDAVRVSKAQIVTEDNGFDHVQAFLNPRRAVLCCPPIGRMDRILADCTQHLSTTVRRGEPLTNMPTVQARIGKMRMAVHVSRALIDPALAGLARGTADPFFDEIVSTAKYQITEHALAVALDSLRLTGALGYSRVAQFERHLRDFCGLIAGAGAQDVLELNLGSLAVARSSNHALR